MKQDEIVIVAAKRSPIGNLLGNLSTLSAPQLGAASHKAAILAADLNPNDIDEVINGCVLTAGLGQAPARQAAIFAGIPYSAHATTINKMCGSGMQAVILAHDLLRLGSANIVLAGGMESMSNAPYFLSKARTGYRLGHGELKDHMYYDGLEDAYDRGKLMGYFAEQTAAYYNFSRETQDEYAMRSLNRALTAMQNNYFAQEITPIQISTKKTELIIDKDEGPDESKLAKIPLLKPAFKENGTVTAANSSSISDGAASIILTTGKVAENRKLTPLARIVAYACHSQEPQWFTTAPIFAIQKVLEKANWQCRDVDLFEINEAFAVVVLAAMQELKLDPNKVNIHGGGCVLGHPIGASGARILVTLIHALKTHQKKRGIAALCIGGGEALAMAIEVL